MNKNNLYILLSLLIFVSCSQEQITDDSQQNDIITLSAAVTNIGETNTSRAAVTATPYSEATPSSDNPLQADIWFSTTSGTYLGTTYGVTGVSGQNIDAHTTINYVSGSATQPAPVGGDYLHYPTSNTVYCVGMYPKNTDTKTYWTLSDDGKSVTAALDGVTDLMYASQIEGSSSNKFNVNPQVYNHIQTWLKIRVRTEDPVAAVTWGKLNKITVNTQKTGSITLVDGTTSFSNDVTLTAYENTDGLELSTTSTEIGNLFVAPVVAESTEETKEYTLHVDCANHSKDVEVSLCDNDANPFAGSTAGKLFVITLYFKTLDYIQGSVTLEDWSEEYRDLEMK